MGRVKNTNDMALFETNSWKFGCLLPNDSDALFPDLGLQCYK